MAWDYRKILMAYIQHVGQEEGTDFLGFAAVDSLRELGLDADEIEELEHVAGLTIPAEEGSAWLR